MRTGFPDRGTSRHSRQLNQDRRRFVNGEYVSCLMPRGSRKFYSPALRLSSFIWKIPSRSFSSSVSSI
jgi:hypothetical protein